MDCRVLRVTACCRQRFVNNAIWASSKTARQVSPAQTTVRLPTGHCGNASVEPEYSEQCDGTNNSDTHPSACRQTAHTRAAVTASGLQRGMRRRKSAQSRRLLRHLRNRIRRCASRWQSDDSSQPYYGNVPQPGRTESGPGLVIFPGIRCGSRSGDCAAPVVWGEKIAMSK